MEFALNGKVVIEADGSVSLTVSVYSKDMRTEYGAMFVRHGELVKTLGKKNYLTNEVWPAVKQVFHL